MTELEGDQRIQFFTEEAEDSKIEKVFYGNGGRPTKIKEIDDDKNSACKCLIF